MILIENFKLCLTLSIIGQLSGLSFNQPKFCPAATWNSLGTIFAAYDIIHGSPYSIFITTNNSIYVLAHAIPNIYIWLNSSVNPTITITEFSSIPQSIFVKNDDELYIERVTLSKRNIEKWILNTNSSTVVMNNITPYPCYSIFIDIINYLYCSLDQRHTVVKNWLGDDDTTPMIVAGTGFAGSTSNTLIQPSGLFVDASLNLYVADFGNHRIQKFRPEESHGITVAGATSLNITTSLNYPTGVTMDGHGYLYIVDFNKNRIVRGGLNGFQCIIGCVASGLAANQLSGPRDMAFDSYGNIYVADSRNQRIQKFSYSKTSCDPITNVSLITSSRSPSFNQPKFCPAAAWNPFGSTFSVLNIIRGPPDSIFITTNNSIYVVVHAISHIYIWFNNSVNPTITITEFSTSPQSIFVKNDNELYIERVTLSKRNIEKWILNTNSSTVVMNNITPLPCYSIFIDIINYLYCSLNQRHTVVKNWLDDDDTTPMIVVGNGFPGSTSNTLNSPYGVFVDASLNLYVADYGNHRIQMFPPEESQGITVAGATSLNITTSLNYPTGVTMDGDGYLYIVDQGNHRIVRKELNGFRCILGCTTFGSAANQLSGPRDMAFDSYGNIYVTDSGNGRIQKFSYAKVSCNPITNVSLLTSSRSPWFNQPKFCPAATWNSFGAIFSAKNIISGTPDSIFITPNHSIYVLAQGTPNIYVWSNSSINPTITISNHSSSSRSIFVRNDNELYIERGTSNKRTIEKWILNTNSSTPVMDIVAPCYSIFIDIVNNLYCSLNQYHMIMKNWLDDDDTTPMIVAGTEFAGSTSNTLNSPYGVFVDASLNLYVADFGNHRIQMFPPEESQGITVAGEKSINITINLRTPTGITMDSDGYLYIVDQGNHRIVRGGSTGFRCILGCITSGSESYKLKRPRDMAFDSDGNIYVVDEGNQRIQKFSYPKLSCEPTTTITRTTSTPVVSHSTKALAGYLIQCLVFFMLYI